MIKTLEGKTRRYRIYVSAVSNRPHKGYEFVLWIQRRWSKYATLKGANADTDRGLPWVILIGRVTGLSSEEIQKQFDDWNEAEFGIADESELCMLGK